MLIIITYIISFLLFTLGLWGVVVRRDNLIITLVCLEMALLGVALQFSTSALILDDFFRFDKRNEMNRYKSTLLKKSLNSIALSLLFLPLFLVLRICFIGYVNLGSSNPYNRSFNPM